MPPLRMHSSTTITRWVFFTEFCTRNAKKVRWLRRTRWVDSDSSTHRDGGLVKRLERDEVNHLWVIASYDSLLHRLLHHVAVAERVASQAFLVARVADAILGRTACVNM